MLLLPTVNIQAKKHAGTVYKGAVTHGFKFEFGNQLILGNGYACSQWHCHFKSEHTIDDQYTVGECHLVCHKQSIAELLGAPHLNSGDKEALRVFGIMIKQGDATTADNAVFKEILDNYALATEAGVAASVTLPDPVATSLWRYYGSLTTPNCQEIVHWTVFNGGITISPAQAALITANFAEGTDRNNFRLIQERNDRPVTVYKYNAKLVSASSAGQITFGILVALVGMLF
jgi:carbonic anhydrase